MKPPRNTAEKAEPLGLCTPVCVNKRVFAGWLPIHRAKCVHPASLNPNTAPGPEQTYGVLPWVQEPQAGPVWKPVHRDRTSVHTYSSPKNMGGPGSICKAAGTESGATPCSLRGGPHPLTQLAPGPISNLELPVTYFPLLLFLEVLMSMQNSAERLSEKKKEREKWGDEGRE